MITKEDNILSLLTTLLDCGYMDTDFLIDLVTTIDNEKFKIKGKEDFLFYVDKEGKILNEVVENIKSYEGEVNINSVLYEVYSMVIRRIEELYNIEIFDDCEIFTNCLDSHLWIDEENINKLEITKQDKQEIKDIIETFN